MYSVHVGVESYASFQYLYIHMSTTVLMTYDQPYRKHWHCVQ